MTTITLTPSEAKLLLANERNDHQAWSDIANKIRTAQRRTDEAALDAIAHMLRDPEWGVGMLGDIGQLVARTGRDLDGGCAGCVHPAIGDDVGPCEADGCTCPQHEPQLTWDRH